MTTLRHDPIERDAPTPIAPPEGPYEVWALTDDGAERILSTDDEAHAQTTFRKHGHAVARGGVVLRFNVNLTGAQQRVLKHAVKHAAAPKTAPETPPPAENPAAHEEPVTKTTDIEEATEIPCTAKGCDAHRAAVRADTHEELVEFCKRHRKLAHDRARDWGLTLKEAAQTLRDGVTERPTERRDAKPANVSQPRKKAPKPARKVAKAKGSKPKAPPSPTAFEQDYEAHVLDRVTRAFQVIIRLGGIERAEKIAEAHAFRSGT